MIRQVGNNAVVFGGTGFLGSHVADVLTERGFDVTIFDLKESKYLKNGQNMVIGDILDSSKVQEVVDGADIVFHFAGVADIKQANEKPVNAVQYNILGTTTILDACVRANVAKFIFSSTVYVYSEHGGFYRSTKQACELLIENYQKTYGLDFTILRFGSLYGRRANDFNWIHEIIKQALKEGKIQRKGDGEELRDYIHVQDAAQACVDVLDDKFRNEYLIISGSQTIKVKELLRMINEIMDNKIQIEYLDEHMEGHYEVTPYTFRPRLAKKFSGNTTVELGQGILDTIYDVYKELKRSEDEHPIITLPEEK
tara:strand:- start:255 stop:1187 length:933 start_codon:yes stop_codon:yes gene_type:complete